MRRINGNNVRSVKYIDVSMRKTSSKVRKTNGQLRKINDQVRKKSSCGRLVIKI